MYKNDREGDYPIAPEAGKTAHMRNMPPGIRAFVRLGPADEEHVAGASWWLARVSRMPYLPGLWPECIH